jgi:hypothetical protein
VLPLTLLHRSIEENADAHTYIALEKISYKMCHMHVTVSYMKMTLNARCEKLITIASLRYDKNAD